MYINFAQRGISVTDGIKNNEQNKSIATGHFYVLSKFEAIQALLPDDVVALNFVGYQISYTLACARHQIYFHI